MIKLRSNNKSKIYKIDLLANQQYMIKPPSQNLYVYKSINRALKQVKLHYFNYFSEFKNKKDTW